VSKPLAWLDADLEASPDRTLAARADWNFVVSPHSLPECLRHAGQPCSVADKAVASHSVDNALACDHRQSGQRLHVSPYPIPLALCAADLHALNGLPAAGLTTFGYAFWRNRQVP